jgi:DedD protein
MGTRSEAPDLAVDELKRRARRRLVGAIVLALAAAVLLPLLLESEPKPLGDDVSIQIPPIDNGKFVNPLSPDKDKLASPPGRSDDAGAKSAAPASAAAPAPSETPPASEAKPPAPEPAPAAAAPPTAEAKPEPTAAAPKVDAKPEPPAKDGNADGNAFVVQVAAFTDRYGALALVRKLKAAGFPGYTEPVTTAKGAMHRVRVGPYASRDAAEAARVKLKAAGYDAMVARA